MFNSTSKRLDLPIIKGEESDEEIIEHILSGDASYFKIIYKRYLAKVRATIFRLAGGDHIDDMTQEAFIRIYQGLGKLKERRYLSTWIYRVSVNVVFDFHRRKGSHVETADTKVEEEHEGTYEIQSSIFKRQMIEKGLRSLSLEHRTVLVLHDLEELTMKEISGIVESPVGTVKSRLFHARKQMREALINMGVEI